MQFREWRSMPCRKAREAVFMMNLAGCNNKVKDYKKSVLFLVNHDVVIYNFRLELVERLLSDGYEVHISSPYGDRIDELVSLGAVFHEIKIDRHGKNPMADFRVFCEYRRLVCLIHPVIILGYTIKPNIYGAVAGRSAGIPFVANITGLGTAVGNKGIGQKFIIFLYKAAFANIQRVFFQNKEDMSFFQNLGIASGRHRLLPGSGVNLDRYACSILSPCGSGKDGSPVKFAFISRIMKEKGIDQYLEAAMKVKKSCPATQFHVCGFCEPEYEDWMKRAGSCEVAEYHGMIRDVAGFMKEMHCIVHPTYYPEGLSNVLLEACACGRPVITTDRAGCREAVRDGINGYLVPEKNADELAAAMQRFAGLCYEEKAAMGEAGRRLAEKQFNRQIVVDAYMEEVKSAERKTQKGRRISYMNRERIKRCMKHCLPWKLRYFIKLQEAKGNIRLPDGLKQKRSWREYNDAFYKALEVLKIRDFRGKSVCEMGPGQYLLHPFLEYQLGADREVLLEIDDFADEYAQIDMAGLSLEHEYEAVRMLPEQMDGASWHSCLKRINAAYKTNGLTGYREIPDGSMDYVFSFSVLEHIRKREFAETLREVYRFLSPGGVSYHAVDFTDHFGGKKNHLRFTESVWEDEVHYKMDNYTNRLSCSEMCSMMKEIGFTVLKVRRKQFCRLPVSRRHLYEGFAEISRKDLMTAGAVIIAVKKQEK